MPSRAEANQLLGIQSKEVLPNVTPVCQELGMPRFARMNGSSLEEIQAHPPHKSAGPALLCH